MPDFNITPEAAEDGLPYAVDVPLTTTEADLAGGDGVVTPAPFPTTFNQAIVATVTLTVTGFITGNSTYVVMQMDMGDDVWYDLCWVFWDGRQGSARFAMSNGIAGANVIQQTRQSGAVPNPQVSGANQFTLGGRIRFVGRTVMIGGSSSILGTPTAVRATVKYKLLGLR